MELRTRIWNKQTETDGVASRKADCQADQKMPTCQAWTQYRTFNAARIVLTVPSPWKCRGKEIMTFKELCEKMGFPQAESDWTQHENGGGWIYKTATVDKSAFVAGIVFGAAQVYGAA